MIEEILSELARFITGVISNTGYTGIFLLMAIESACIPAPSEVIMPFSGFLVFSGQFNLHLVAIAGALGNVAGSWLAWWAGWKGGRPFIQKYGRYILISEHDLTVADRFFSRYGAATVFFSRMLPVIRTYISFPAGIARMPLAPFLLYTFIGALPWCYLLTYIGISLGERWESLRGYFREFDVLIAAVLILGVIWYVWRHIRHSRRTPDGG